MSASKQKAERAGSRESDHVARRFAKVLTSAADDAIEAEEVEEGILLKPSPAVRRRAGLADIRQAVCATNLNPE